MNEALLDELLGKAIPRENDSRAPYDWAVIHAWMIIKLGSDQPTMLDAQIERGVNPKTGRARPMRYEYHRRLLWEEMSLDDLIENLLVEFMNPHGGRSLDPGSTPGHIVRMFQHVLVDEARRIQSERIVMVVVPDADELGGSLEVRPDDVNLRPDALADLSRIEPRIWITGAELIGKNRELATVLSLMKDPVRWGAIAKRLHIDEETLRKRRTAWGLLDRKDAMDTGFPETVIGRWMSDMFTVNLDHLEHIRFAFGILMCIASSAEDQS